MRLREFTLDLFGHFEGKRFDFGESAPDRTDFHVIYGPNEAGKTTTMEAFLRLLYGFPHRESYDFKHARKNLRLSGVLETDEGLMPVTRLPLRKGDLLDAGGTALPEAALQAHLGGLSETDYRQLLCLDDETIEKGGEEIVSSKGDIGRLLFSAAAGVSDLSQVLENARSRAEALYKKQGSKTELAALKRALTEVTQQIKDHDITASAWRKLRQTAETAEAEEQDARTARAAMLREKATLEARQAGLPMLAELDALDTQLADKGHYPERLDFNPEDLVKHLARQSQLEADRLRLEREIAETETALEQTPRQTTHLALAGALEELEALHTRYASGAMDLDRRRRKAEGLQDDMARAVRDLQATATDPRQLVLTPAQLSDLETRRDAMRGALRDRQRQEKDLAEAEERLTLAQSALSQTPSSDAPVTALLKRHAADHLAPKVAAATEAVQAADRALARALAGLSHGAQVFDALPGAAISETEAETLASRYAECRARLDTLVAEIAERESELGRHRARIAHLRQDDGLIDDATARGARETRDQLWSAHKDAMSLPSAEAFEAAMRKVDDTADVRLARSSTLGQLRHEEEALIDLEARQAHALRQQSDAQDRLAALSAECTGLAKRAGLTDAISPESFAIWSKRLAEAREAFAAREDLNARHSETLGSAAALATALRAALDLQARDFDTLVAEARRAAQAEQDAAQTARSAEQTRNALQSEVTRLQASRDTLIRAADSQTEAWRLAVRETLGETVDPGTLEASFEPLRRLRELDIALRQVERQVASMDADKTDFNARIAALAEAQNEAVADDPIETYKALQTLASDAQKAEDRHAALTVTLSGQKSALDEALRGLADIDRHVATLAAQFPPSVPTNTLNALRTAVGAAQQVIDARKARAKLVAALCNRLDLPDLASVRAALSPLSSATVAAELAALEQDLAAQEARLEQAIESRTVARTELRRVSGAADIARLTEQKATLEARIEDTVLRYLETRFGVRLAEEAIRRYRDSHRSGMIEATEAAFVELTNGAYTRLLTQPDGQAEILVALDAAGLSKQAQDMSKGTRFQLYLALRAAAYAQLTQQGTCLPFFCDDVFETFDEERTRSACRVMARIGRQGQAIYLTHHRHVVDIAEGVCPGAVTVHDIRDVLAR
ncbi:AAA family ATPase [Primorskyibacter sp. 2E107]|uniref:ATP-binding protein n=1 Tax=Primorskyibacter sp. 2E107 TaxID=3403458 RepID=UPI003AF40ECC